MCPIASKPSANSKRRSNSLPLVSIIITCYNCAPFIREAIETALAQTWSRVEVFVVDDGSNDGSLDIIAEYPLRCLRSSRGGVSAARNLGIRACNGEFVVFLDGDDRLLPNAVEAGVHALMQHPDCCMAVGGHRMVSESGDLIRQRTKPLHIRDHYARLLQTNFIECISSVLCRRAHLRQAQGFDTRLPVSEDYDLYLRLAREYPICCHSAIVAEYRLHQSNISRKSALMLTTTLGVLQSQRRYAFTSFTRSACYLYGAAFWRRKYGHQLTRELAMDRSVSLSHPGKELSLLARTYPIGALIVLVFQTLPRGVTRAMFRRSRRIGLPAFGQSGEVLQHR